MASSDRTPDMSRVISDLSRAIHQLVDKVDNLGGTGRPGSHGGAGRARPRNELDLDVTQKKFKTLNASMAETEKEIRNLRRGFSDTNRSLDELYRSQNEVTRGIIANERLTSRAQKNLVESISKSIRHYSFMGQTMVNAGKKIEFLEEKLEETGKFLSQYGEILKDVNEQNLSSITDSDKLRKVLHKLNKEMTLSEDVQEMIRKNEFARAAQALDDEARNANTIRTSIRRTSTSFGALNRVTDGLREGVQKATDAIGLGFTREAATLAGSAALIIAGTKEAYNQYWQNASAGFGGAFIDMSVSAIKLGISLEQLNTITKENMNLIGKMGLRGFTNSLKESQSQLMQLGLTAAEAAKTSAIMSQNAFLTGVDVRNKQALAKASREQMSAYEDMRAVTGESIEALAAQTKAILTDNETTKIMGALNKQQRVQMIQSINMERKRLVTMGLTNEAAINVIKSFHQIQNSKFADRLDAGFGAMAASSALGMDPNEAAKAAAIMQRGKAAMKDPENQKFMAEYARKLAKANDKLQGSGDVNAQILGDQVDDWTQQLSGMKDSMREANLDRGLTPAEVESNKALGRVPAAIADASAKIETWARILESPLTKIMIGVLGIGALLLKHFAKPKAKPEIPPAPPRAEPARPDAPDTPDVDKEKKKKKKKVGARPGDSVQEPDRFSSQMTQVAKKHGWTDKQHTQEQGLAGHQQLAREIQERKKERARRATDAGRQEDNNRSIGSEALQERKRINAQMVRERQERENQLQGPPAPPRARTVADRIDDFSERTGRRRQETGRRISNAISETRTQIVDRVNGFGDRMARRAIESAPGRTGAALGRAGRASIGAVTGSVGSAVGAVTGGASKALSGAMSMGAKALPLIGLAVTAIEGLKGAFDAVDRSAEIFGVDTKKTAITSAQKISAGIAGALNTLTFGLIPTDATARLMHDVATEGATVITDQAERAVEWIVNNGIPALYSAFKSVMGFIGGAIVDALSPSTWIAAFTGEGGDGGIVGTILRHIIKGVQFMGTALAKGAIKVGADLIEGMINLIPDWAGGKAAKEKFAKMKAESEKGGLMGFASSDTKYSDFDTKEEAKARKEREAKRAAKDKKEKQSKDRTYNDSDANRVQATEQGQNPNEVNGEAGRVQGTTQGENPDEVNGEAGRVQGTTPGQNQNGANGEANRVQGAATDPSSDNLGMVNRHGEELTRDQLAAQGVQATPAQSGTPSVDNPSGASSTTPGAAPGGNNNTASATPPAPDRSAEETLLAEIRDKMTALVDLTDKSFQLAQKDSQLMSTRQRMGQGPGPMSSDGYAPSLSSFLNMPM
jgi:hypothetical protein